MGYVLNARWRVEADRVHAYKRHIHQSMETAAERLAQRAKRRAVEVAAQRTRTGDMMRGIEFDAVVEGSGRVKVVGHDKVWYAHFQDRGTKRGVTPLLFLEHGLAAAAEVSIAEISSEARVPVS